MNKQRLVNLGAACAFILMQSHTFAENGVTKFGSNALQSNTGHTNSAFGSGALFTNTTGNNNTATGNSALFSNTTGNNNSANGQSALGSNTTGSNNTANGYFALRFNTLGFDNTANGSNALRFNTTGRDNAANGSEALRNNTTGSGNTANGSNALRFNTTGSNNTANGVAAMSNNTTGFQNTANGTWALRLNMTGRNNTANGYSALADNTTGSQNTATGFIALFGNTTGNQNAATGYEAMLNNIDGHKNTALGAKAGYSNVTGNKNVFVGYRAGYDETGNNKLYIANNRKTPLLYGTFSSTPSNNKLGIGTTSVPSGDAIKVWNGAHLTKGGVWANASSRNLKDNIESLSVEDATTALAALNPVRYVYKNSREEEYLGFIAEDVPALVATHDRKSLATMDIVAVLTRVVKQQQVRMEQKDREATAQLTKKNAEIVALRVSAAALDGRMLKMELAMGELLRKQASEDLARLIN